MATGVDGWGRSAMADPNEISEELRGSLQRHRGETGTDAQLVPEREEVHVGDDLTLHGRDLPAETSVTVVWHTVDGSWAVLEANEVVGPQYSPRTETLTTATTDEDGRFDETVTVPEDYGSSHTVELRDGDGTTLARDDVEVLPRFELLNDEAPLGDFFVVRGHGIGPNPVRNNYQIAWDNGMVGILTGVQNHGTATARIRAVGPVGTHDLRVWRSYRGFPFLQANTQSTWGPVGGDRQSDWQVTVTPPASEPTPAWTEDQVDERPLPVHYPDLDDPANDAVLEITPTSGTPGTQAVVQGWNFPADEAVDLVWHRHAGKRLEGTVITPEPKPDLLPTVRTDADGSFQVDVEIPTDRGASRPITAEVGGESIAITGFVLQPEIREFSPTSGPKGTEIDIAIGAIGWTLYENAHFLVYDNRMLGYFCGNCDDGDDGVVHLSINATGEPGYHFIDVYPTIFQTKSDDAGFECKPHLSYLDNHPIRPLPAHHLAFEITE